MKTVTGLPHHAKDSTVLTRDDESSQKGPWSQPRSKEALLAPNDPGTWLDGDHPLPEEQEARFSSAC